MLNVIVKRSEWLRGEGNGRSYLLRESDGRKCCLGEALIAAGVNKENIISKTTPSLAFGLDTIPSTLVRLLVRGSIISIDSEIGRDLMRINDTDSYSDAEREAELIETSPRAGINFSFVD